MEIVGMAVSAYLGLVILFEIVVVVFGARQAASGVQPPAPFVVIGTADSRRSRESVVAAVEVDGHLYVATNHWPRSWFLRAVRSPEVEVTRGGERRKYLAAPVEGPERERVSNRYRLPFAIRFLTGFPPRAFLRLNPR
jgi:hypothetical protein